MSIKNLIFIVITFILSVTSGNAQELVLYKQIDTTRLFLELRYPDNFDKANKYPAMVFFFGGGWKGGGRNQFYKHADYFAKRGMVCFLVDYRTENRHHTTPYESLKDAKSAIRYIRTNAKEFGVDPHKIVASGGSAGGHLAAATALINNYSEDSDDLNVSCVPNVLVLFNPVIDNGPGGYGYDRIRDDYINFSPLHNIKKGAPPTIIFLGTEDKLIPVETMEYYRMVMQKVGSRCELKLYDGEGHGFFNYNNFENYKLAIAEADNFLQSLGYLKEKAVLEIE